MSQSGAQTVKTGGGAVVETLTGNTGGAVGPDASFNINIIGNNSTGINVIGNTGSSTLTITAYQATTTQEGTVTLATNAQAAAQTNASNVLTPSNITSFFSTNPLPVSQGGTGDTSFTAYMPICGGTTSTGALQSVATGTAGYVLTYVSSSALPTWQAVSADGAITTIDGDSGSMTPLAGVVTISGGTTGLTTTASSHTMDLTGVLITANGGTSSSSFNVYGPVVAGSSTTAALTSVVPSSTSGIPFISQGSSANPVFGTAVVAGGGTGDTSFTAYSVLCGGTTSTSALQNVSGVGSSGQVLTSNGASALPTWQNGADVLAITSVSHAASPYLVQSTDQFIACQSSTGTIIIEFGNSSVTGRVRYVKDSTGNAATNNISITTVGGTVTFDGQTTYVMKTNYQSVSIIFDGTNYEVF